MTAIAKWCVGITVLFICIQLTVEFDFQGKYEGLYLLKARNGRLLTLKNDIFLGEYEFLISKFEFKTIRAFFESNAYGDLPRSTPYIKSTWDEVNGDGYFMTIFPDGTKFLNCFGRYVDDGKKKVHGLFVGGGLPLSEYENNTLNLNETGVAFFDGKKWQHLWCIANEVIYSASNPLIQILPSSWTFLGSKVLLDTEKDLIIKSMHQVKIDNGLVHIDRYMIYRAGDNYFTLSIKFTNIGATSVTYNYLYGDEPWIGTFGSSAGNIGWTQGTRHNYETPINPYASKYIGMFDIGNIAAGEKNGEYSGLANFIEWLGDVHPDFAYFSNQFGKVDLDTYHIPLDHKTSRVLAVQWSNRVLAPGSSEAIILAIGMADTKHGTALPEKPTVKIDSSFLK